MKVSKGIPMYLQLFGNGEGFESSVNAEPVVNVEPQQTEVVNTDANVSSEVVDTQPENKPVQSAEENAKYASIRREIEANAKLEAQKVIDAEYSRLYGEQYGIHSKADYDRAVKEAEEQQRLETESERMNASPELLKEIEELKAFKNEVMTKEEQRIHDENVKAIDKEVNDILEIAKNDGVEITKEQLVKTALDKGITDLKDAYKLLKPDIDLKTIKENAIKEYIESKRNGVIPVEGSGNTSISTSEAPKDFKSAREGAAAMLRAAKLFNN